MKMSGRWMRIRSMQAASRMNNTHTAAAEGEARKSAILGSTIGQNGRRDSLLKTAQTLNQVQGRREILNRVQDEERV